MDNACHKLLIEPTFHSRRRFGKRPGAGTRSRRLVSLTTPISESSTDCDVGIPHVNVQDEIINGYLIPKGSLININNGYVARRPNILNYDDDFKVHAHQS